MTQKRIKNHKKTSPKNTPKKKRPNFNQNGPKGDQNTTDKGGKGRDPGWNPPRKKKNIAKPDLLRGKGACWKGYTQTLRSSTRSAGGLRPARGRIFRCILVALWLPFGSVWAPVGHLLAPLRSLWHTFAHPWALFSHFGVSQRHFIHFYCIVELLIEI